jgi:hypothetical protein
MVDVRCAPVRPAKPGGSCYLQAQVKRGRPVAAEYDLDVLGNKPQLSLPTHSREGGVAASNIAGAPAASSRGLLSSRHAKERSGKSAAAKQGANSDGGGGGELSEGVREKLATVLAKEFSRKVRARVISILGKSSGCMDCCQEVSPVRCGANKAARHRRLPCQPGAYIC